MLVSEPLNGYSVYSKWKKRAVMFYMSLYTAAKKKMVLLPFFLCIRIARYSSNGRVPPKTHRGHFN